MNTGRVWDDRLAEVWASPGKAGSGVVLGDQAVLTARHVVAGALESGQVLARVVRPGSVAAQWSPMTVGWSDDAWDVALLVLDSAQGNATAWLPPRSSAPVLVRLGTAAEAGCETVGFPDAEKLPDADGRPDQVVRQSEQVVGTLLPAGQGKLTSHAEARLPVHSVPFDVDTTHPGTAAGWQGCSGAAVVLADGRLAGVVVAADPDHQLARLYVVLVADVLGQSQGLAQALAAVTGQLAVAQVRDAPTYAAALRPQCLGPDGSPRLIGEVGDLDAFGVKPADLPGEPLYLDYIRRDEDDHLLAVLDQARQQRKMLLVVGASGAGKSRSAAEAVRERLGDHRLICPMEDALPQLAGLAMLKGGEPVVVWLDEIQQQAGSGRLRSRLRGLLDEGAVVVATIRRAELEQLTMPGEVRNPAGEALSDASLVLRVSWRRDWSAAERERGRASLSHPGTRTALAQGHPLGVWCVAGAELVWRFDDGAADDERPFRYLLVRTVLDWYRTRVGLAVPIDAAIMLASLAGGLADQLPDDQEIADALQWSLQPVIGGGRQTRQSLLTRGSGDALSIHDFLLDHAQQSPASDVADDIWQAALSVAEGARRFDIGTTAFEGGRPDIAREAYEPLADVGNVNALTNIGSLLAEDDPAAAERLFRQAAERGDSYAMFNLAGLLEAHGSPEARIWYERAAEAGLSRAMYQLGVLLAPDDPAASRHWYERGAEAGDLDAMVNLGVLLGKTDQASGRRWLEQAAEAGHQGAMYNLGVELAGQEPATAQRWYERAAGLGDTGAMVNLGVLLAESDHQAAIRWLTRSADAGNAMGMAALGGILHAEDPEQARRWLRRGAELGDAGAQYNLGVLLTDSDPEESRRLFEQAARAGNTAARFNLGVLLTPSNPELARHWYEQATQAGPEDKLHGFAILAHLNLGVLLTASDRPAALEHLREAAEAGEMRAVLPYALMLQQDQGAGAAKAWLRGMQLRANASQADEKDNDQASNDP